MDKETASQTLRAMVRELARRLHGDPDWAHRFHSGDDSCIDEVLKLACDEQRVSVADFEQAFESVPELRVLQKKLIADAILGPIDPTRESLGARVEPKRKPWWKFF